MKKLLFLTFIILLVGCTPKAKVTDDAKYEKLLKEYGVQYFERYVAPYRDNTPNADVFEVSYALLKNANKMINAQFNLEEFKDCTDDTRVEMDIDKETYTITNYKYIIKCD
jgi:hypothetical protein